jgi:pimeloyl-ACP methyl ester carboxylesterase
MKFSIFLLFTFFSINLFAQDKIAEEYGFRHLQTIYKGDVIDILIKSKPGEENVSKPLFLFCQGSLPVPLMIRYEKDGKKLIYNVFPFHADSLAKDYHIVIVGKPYVPLVADEKSLNSDMSYKDSTGKFPKKYIERNLLHYYVKRDITVLTFLRNQSWAAKDKLVVAGHSEGSAVAAKIAADYSKVTALIYSGGNPLGRTMTLMARARINETDSSKAAENIFQYWKNVIDNPGNVDGDGDTYKLNYQFSYPPPMNYLQKLKIPVLVTYGTKDDGLVNAADYFRLEMIRLNKNNFTFKDYIGLEHNFFPVKPNGEINYDIYNWDKVAEDWRSWLKALQ